RVESWTVPVPLRERIESAVTKASPRSGNSGHGGHSNSVKQPPPGGPEVQPPVLFLLGGGGQAGSVRWAIITAMAAKNKCLAQMNKSGTAGEATKKERKFASRVDTIGADDSAIQQSL